MDELEFNADAISNADANLEIEGYKDQVEAIQQAYPEEDWRTPAEQEAEKEALDQEISPTENVESAQTAEPVTPEVIPETKGNQWKGKYEGDLLDINQVILENNIDPEYARDLKLNVNMSGKQIDLWDKWNKAGGQRNVEATWELVSSIQNDPELLAVSDRNGDGQFTFADFYDVTRLKQMGMEITPERDAQITAIWLNGLQNKNILSRLPALAQLGGSHLFMHPMANYNHQRRLGILTDLDNNPFTVEMGGEQMRQSLSGGIAQGVGDMILSAPEKIYAGFNEGLTDDDDETWFSWDAALKKDAVLDDIVYNHKDPLSFGYGTLNPVKRTWSDPVLFEMGRYAPAIAISAKVLPAAATTITTGGAGLSGKGIATFALTTAKTLGVTYATEVLPTNVFADLESNAMKNMREDKTLSQVINAHPETLAGGLLTANGQDNAVTRQLEFMRQEMGWEAGGIMVSHFAFRGIGNLLGQIPEQLSKKHWQKTQISLNAKQKLKETPDNLFQKRKQIQNDQFDAAIDQQKIAQEGPSSKWQDPWDSDGGLDSTFGDFKNLKTVAGQQSTGVRSGIADVVDQIDEIKGQVGLPDNGITDDVFSAVERAEFSKSGIPDPWNKEAADAYWKNVDVQGRLNELNPLQRNLKNLSESSLQSIQEILGRDFSSLAPENFWPKEFLEMKFKPGEKLNDTKKWVIENLQVKDAVVNGFN